MVFVCRKNRCCMAAATGDDEMMVMAIWPNTNCVSVCVCVSRKSAARHSFPLQLTFTPYFLPGPILLYIGPCNLQITGYYFGNCGDILKSFGSAIETFIINVRVCGLRGACDVSVRVQFQTWNICEIKGTNAGWYE